MARRHDRRWPHVLGFLDAGPVLSARILDGIIDVIRERPDWTLETLTHQRLLECRDRLAAVVAVTPDAELAGLLRRRRAPLVSIHGHLPDHVATTVTLDDERVGELGAEHLLGCGLDRIVYLGRDEAFSHARARGFARVARRDAGVDRPAKEHVTCLRWSYRRPLYQRTIAKWLATLRPPVGIMAWNDDAASLVVGACETLGLRVPDDVAVLGVDNDVRFCEVRRVTLSTVDTNLRRLGYEAAQCAVRIAGGEPRPGKPILVPPAGVVARASTDVIRVSDELVVEAVRWLRARACSGIQPRHVIEAVGVSRSLLNGRFRAALGRSIGDEIRVARIARARRMLTETQTPLTEIALSCGFADLSHFCNVFRREYGITPGRYRKAAASRVAAVGASDA